MRGLWTRTRRGEHTGENANREEEVLTTRRSKRQKVQEIVVTIIQWIGIPSITALILFYLAFIGLLPELVIEGVADKSAKFSSESKLIIRNVGKLGAIGIQANVEDVTFRINTISLTDGLVSGGPTVAGRLASGESTEISVTSGIGLGSARPDEFRYKLTLSYDARLIFLKKSFAKQWSVELKNRPDGHHWEVRII
jgi:hypothetical protein